MNSLTSDFPVSSCAHTILSALCRCGKQATSPLCNQNVTKDFTVQKHFSFVLCVCVSFFFVCFFKLASEVLKATSWNCHFHLWCLALNEAFVAYLFQVHNTQPLFHTFVPARRFSLASSPLPCFLSLLFFSSLQPHCVWKLLKSWMVRAKMKSSCLYIIIFSFYLF